MFDTNSQPFLEAPSFEFVDLDVDNTVQTRVLNWVSDRLIIENNTPYPLYINWRTSAIPSPQTFEKLVPGGMYTSTAVVGNNFGFFLDTAGSSIPAIGKKCLVTIQRGGASPSFSIANYRSQLDAPLTISALNPEDVFDVNTAGAYGILINLHMVSSGAGNGVLFKVQTSPDGILYNDVKLYQVFPNHTLMKIFPAGVGHYRFKLNPLIVPDTIVGSFTYSLLPFYSDMPAQYRQHNESLAPQAVNTGVTIVPLATFGAQIVRKIWCYFETPLPTDTWRVTLLGTGDSGQIIRISLTNDPPRGGTTREDVGAPHLVHRRINEWGFEIPVEWHYNNDFTVNLINEAVGSVNLTNVTVGYETSVEI